MFLLYVHLFDERRDAVQDVRHGFVAMHEHFLVPDGFRETFGLRVGVRRQLRR
jgi:hypothetical protein